jgi:hypothetical protein
MGYAVLSTAELPTHNKTFHEFYLVRLSLAGRVPSASLNGLWQTIPTIDDNITTRSVTSSITS